MHCDRKGADSVDEDIRIEDKELENDDERARFRKILFKSLLPARMYKLRPQLKGKTSLIM